MTKKTENFDELMKDLNYNILYLNFTKFHKFLGSNSEEICFPYLSKRCEQVFKTITRDINVLKSKSLDGYYRNICDKIIEAVNLNKSVYFLSCGLEHRKTLGEALVLKKVYLKKESVEVNHVEKEPIEEKSVDKELVDKGPVQKKPVEKEPIEKEPVDKKHVEKDSVAEEPSLHSSMENLMPSSESSSSLCVNKQGDPDELLQRSTTPDISLGFKIHCLTTTLTFVKNDVTKKIEFPEMIAEKVEFLHLLLKSVVAFADFDDSGIKYLYRALCEAVKIYSLKYEFKVNCIETLGEKKTLVFEKIDKQKPVRPVVNSNELILNGFRLKPKLGVLNVKTNEERSQVTPLLAPITTDQKISDIALEPTMEAKSNKQSMNKQKPKLSKKEKKLKNLQKKELKSAERNAFVKSFSSTFILNTLTTFKDFLENDNTNMLVLVAKSANEYKFYNTWSMIASNKNFDGEYKELYDKIMKLLFRVKCKKQKNGKSTVYGFKEVIYMKIPKGVPIPKAYTPPVDEPITAQSGSRKVNRKLKKLANLDNSTESIQTARDRSFRNKKKNKKQRREMKHSFENKLAPISTSTRTYLKPLQTDLSTSEDAGSESSRSQSTTTLDRPPTLPKNIKIDFQPATSEWCDPEASSSESCRNDHVSTISRPSTTSGLNCQQQTTDEVSYLQAGSASRKRHLTELNSENKEVPEKLTKWKIFKRKPELKERVSKFNKRKSHTHRNEKLIELLSRPVQCDKAMKMMQGMGWSGGGLGARGTGIIEPIMPQIDGLSRACLGISVSTSRPRENRSVTEIGGNWETEDLTDQSQTQKYDYIVEKTKEILREDFSIDTLTKKFIKKQVSRHSKKSPTRQIILKNILQLLSTNETSRVVTFEMPLFKNDMRFLLKGVNGLDSETLKKLPNVEKGLVAQIIKKYDELLGVTVVTNVTDGDKVVKLTKQQTYSKVLKEQAIKPQKAILGKLIEGGEECSAFLEDILPLWYSKKDFRALRFKALIMLKILIFIKSEDSEIDVVFYKVLKENLQSTIESIIVAVNSREQFGNSQIEIALIVEIKKHIGDYFLGIIFNHKYTSFTLTKYYPRMLKKPAATINLVGLAKNNANGNNHIEVSSIKNLNKKRDNLATALASEETTDKSTEVTNKDFLINDDIEDCVTIDDSNDDYTDYISSDEDELISTEDNINEASIEENYRDIDQLSFFENDIIIIDSDDNVSDNEDDIKGTANKNNEASHQDNHKDEKIKSETTDLTNSKVADMTNNPAPDNNCNVENNNFTINENNGTHKNVVINVTDDENCKIICEEHKVNTFIENNENKSDAQNNEFAKVIEINGNLNVDRNNCNQVFATKNEVIDSETTKNIYEREEATNKETAIDDLDKVITEEIIIENANNEINITENVIRSEEIVTVKQEMADSNGNPINCTKNLINSKKVAILKQEMTENNDKAIGNINKVIDMTVNDDSEEIYIINEDIADDNESLVIDVDDSEEIDIINEDIADDNKSLVIDVDDSEEIDIINEDKSDDNESLVIDINDDSEQIDISNEDIADDDESFVIYSNLNNTGNIQRSEDIAITIQEMPILRQEIAVCKQKWMIL